MRVAHIRRSRKRLSLKSEMNLVPYIDVMLVLLIIFMVSAPLINASVDVSLPRADVKAINAAKSEPLIVEVDNRGHLFLRQNKHDKIRVSTTQLKTQVRVMLRHNPHLRVLVAGDKSGRYDGVYQALSDLQQAGVSKVGLMSTPKPGKSDARHE